VHKAEFTDPVFFVGVAGMGMSSLAEISHHLGYTVQGSDSSSSPVIDNLRAKGLRIFDSHEGKNVDHSRTVVYSSAIPQSNPELIRARNLGLKVIHRSEFLSMLARGRTSITITGTHGKTTTSALISHILTECGVDPTCLVGGIVNSWGSTARCGASNYLVFEADESDGSFLRYSPFVSVVTNIDLDHLDHYGSLEKMHGSFQQYLTQTSSEGCNIVCWDDPVLQNLSSGEIHRLAFGFKLGSDVRCLDYQSSAGETIFRAVVERRLITARTPLIGKHNVLNCLAALSVAQALELDLDQAAAALATFNGVKRRFERYLTTENLVIVDDYAHNPGKIEAFLLAIRQAWPKHRLIVVFQPHRFSRLRTTFSETINALSSSDLLVLLPVYSAGEPLDQDFSLHRIQQSFDDRLDCEVVAASTLDEAVDACASSIKESTMTVVATVGAGDVWKVSHSLKESFSSSN
jgi:UDP-N-acetylmuramate--alanine ligase